MIENGIMLSVHPYVCKLILGSYNPIILRKSVPKIRYFNCYIYCQDIASDYLVPKGKVIGKFTCNVE